MENLKILIIVVLIRNHTKNNGTNTCGSVEWEVSDKMKCFTCGKVMKEGIEFLMTYGWVLLVILAVLGALIYSGVLDDFFIKCQCPEGYNKEKLEYYDNLNYCKCTKCIQNETVFIQRGT